MAELMLTKPAYFNEIDPYAAQWLRNLIQAGHIAPGDVDERSIEDVCPDDLRNYTQCHFFAGIGIWSLALRRAGWDDSRPVWTGSCPCQPFSAAGQGLGIADERHLWPAFFHLIEQCRPSTVFGEQVEAAIKHGWLDLVHADMEGIDYAFAATGIPAAGVGAPHIRQRLYWVADATGARPLPSTHAGVHRGEEGAWPRDGEPERFSATSGLADSSSQGLAQRERDGRIQREALGSSERQAVIGGSDISRLADADEQQRYRGGNAGSPGRREFADDCRASERPGPTNGFWRAADWLACRDGKWRPVEPGTFPLVDGAAARVGRLRAYGNAISPQVAETFISAFMECQP